MECLLNDSSSVKTLSRAIQCAAKVGEDVAFKATPDRLLLRTLNAMRSTCVEFTFMRTFFASYAWKDHPNGALGNEHSKNVKVSLRSLLPVFKASQATESVKILFDEARLRLVFALVGKSEVKKTFKVPYEEGEVLRAVCDKTKCSGRILVRPRFLMDSLANFHAKLDDLSLAPRDDLLKMSSFVEDLSSTKNMILRTEMNIETSEFEEYSVGTCPDVVLTFSCKAFRSILEFCEHFDVPIDMYFQAHGQPILFELNVGPPGSVANFHADFIFATRRYHAETASNLETTDTEGSRLTPRISPLNQSLPNQSPARSIRRSTPLSSGNASLRMKPLAPLSRVQPPPRPTVSKPTSIGRQENQVNVEGNAVREAPFSYQDRKAEPETGMHAPDDSEDEFVEGTPPPQ